MAARTSNCIALYLLLFCKLCGIGIFMRGFFPLKQNSSGISTQNANGIKVGSKFDRLIIVMIDALRADFVFDNKSRMIFTKGLIQQGRTFSFQAHSNPPTVTMPRIKAITTGTIPGFIDVILNVDSKELVEDNIVSQMKTNNKEVLFFGDDTWIKLFPNHFKRTDGTTSFFVTDYTEVDDNVTRHLKPEMERKDWNVMILHYLGLDHIGHLAGPTSPLVQPKLTEMDIIIQMIYETAMDQDHQRNITTLVMLCGDHGMSDGGSHGGSSFAETTTPLVFMSSVFHNKGVTYSDVKVNQIDIAPTLSLLMGLSIPKNSIGIVIPELLSLHTPEQRLEALRMNSFQIMEVFKSNSKDDEVVELDLAIKAHSEWLAAFANGTFFGSTLDSRAGKISEQYILAMRIMTNKLTKNMSSYDYYALYIGMWLLMQSLLGTAFLHLNLMPELHRVLFSIHSSTGILLFSMAAGLTTYIHFYACSFKVLGSSELFCTFSAISVLLSTIFILSTALTLTIFVLTLTRISSSGLPTWLHKQVVTGINKALTETFLVLGILLHNISLLSTSFIEEEHQCWYFLTTSYHVILLCLEYRKDQGICFSTSGVNSSPVVKNDSKKSYMNNVSDDVNCGTTHPDSIAEKTDRSHEQFFQGGTYIIFMLLCCNRILRAWNQTGIKWADQPDVGDWLVKPENKTILSHLFVIGLITVSVRTYIEANRSFLITFMFTAGGIGVYFYRAVTGSVNILPWQNHQITQKGIPFAQWVHFCVIVLVFMDIYKFLKGYVENPSGEAPNNDPQSTGKLFLIGYLLLILLLLRPHNIPLVAITVLQGYLHHEFIWPRCHSTLEVILSAYYIGWFTYFAQGNSNSLATVDISAGYIGLDQNYSPVLVAILVGLATFSGPLFWLINAVLFLKNHHNGTQCSSSVVDEVCTTILLLKTINVTVCAFMTWLNCYHLFVWSVFSPKLLYEGVISAVFAIFIVVLCQTNLMTTLKVTS